MARNAMHSFATTPQANIPRSRFDMPCNVKFTGNTGKLIPFYICEVLPGDTFNVSTSMVCRLQTLIHPLMDNIYLDTYYFFVPNRLVWDNWKHFCGEPNKAWIADREYTVPRFLLGMNTGSDGGYTGDTVQEKVDDWYLNCFKDSVWDYMGIGLNNQFAPNVEVNALPYRAYQKIYDDWFRDENLIDPVNIYTGDSSYSLTTKLSWQYYSKVFNAPKLHDYFTSALPQAQRGNPVELTFGNNLPVGSLSGINDASTYGLHFVKGDGTTPSIMSAGAIGDQNTFLRASGTSPSIANHALRIDNLFVPAGVSSGINVNDLRMAFQVQKWLERSARGGARYIELLKSMFGVTSPDARLQRSEYLGGHRVPINIHQVVNTSETIETPLGNTGAMSVTSDVHNDFIHSFVEHGFVIGIVTVRYKHSYPNGINRFWTRQTKFDYYWPVFACIGEQPIKNKEIYLDPSSNPGGMRIQDMVFGYQEAWADYRFIPNRVMGEMRPGVPGSLASWTLADNYTQQPILSKDWIEEDLMPVDRAIAVTSSISDQWLFDILINNKATRPMPLYSIPGLVDHF